MNKKIQKVKNNMKKRGMENLFVSNPNNIYYLSGFKCNNKTVQSIYDPECFLLLTPKENFILTDTRYAGAAKNVSNFTFIPLPYPTTPSNFAKLLNKMLAKGRILGFEENSIIYSELNEIKMHLVCKTYDASNIITQQRIVKNNTELNLLAKAAQITSAGYEYALSKLRKGMTEKELASEITSFFLTTAEGNSFPPIVAFGKNSAIPHYEPGNTKIENGGVLLIDLGCQYKGYCGDMTRTVYLGKAPKKFKGIYQEVLGAQKNCLKKIQTGMTGIEGDKLARNKMPLNLRKYFTHGTGHGLGLEVHEPPRLNIVYGEKLQDGMVFSVEPGVYIPRWGGVRIEDIVYLKNGRAVNITRTPKVLREISL